MGCSECGELKSEIIQQLLKKLELEAMAYQALHRSTGNYSLSYSGGYMDGLAVAVKLLKESSV